jgi:hypothetical protein
MIYTVFSTSDSPYMQWQSELLEYSWQKVGQPGELIRLVSTDDPSSLPEHEVARVVATRSWKIHPFTGDDFAPYNKPSSLLEWIYRERPWGTILLLDPDCVFREPVDREVEPGEAVGQHWIDYRIGSEPPFGLGPRFEKAAAGCVDTSRPADPVMIPNLIHTRDMQRIALRWLELTGTVRDHVRNHQDNKMWESDMYGFIMACAEVDLPTELGTLGICTNWSPEVVKDAPIIHYCQRIEDREGQMIWSKGTYRPWEPVPDPETAAVDYGRDLLALINEYVEARTLDGAALRPRRRAGVQERRHGEETELVALGSDRGFLLNFSAQAIWEQCDGERTVETIARELAERFDAPPEQIQADVEAGVRALDRAGVLELS